MNKYLIVWDGGSARVRSIDEAKDKLMYAGCKKGDLHLIKPDDSEQVKFQEHIKLF